MVIRLKGIGVAKPLEKSAWSVSNSWMRPPGAVAKRSDSRA